MSYDDLPDEVLCIILEKIDTLSQYKSAILVSKLWKSIIYEQQDHIIRNMIIEKHDIRENRKFKWYELPNGKKHGLETIYFPPSKRYECEVEWKFGNKIMEKTYDLMGSIMYHCEWEKGKKKLIHNEQKYTRMDISVRNPDDLNAPPFIAKAFVLSKNHGQALAFVMDQNFLKHT